MTDLLDVLIDKLHKGVVPFVYIKKDGTMRNALGTLRGVEHTIKGTGRSEHCGWTLRYYDVDCKGWRSFLIDKLISVGKVRRTTISEHHDICLALVVKLKERLQNGEKVAFAYRKKDGSIRYAHGILCGDTENDDERYFSYYDTDKREKRTFRIDSFISFGEKDAININELEDILDDDNSKSWSNSSNHEYADLSNIKVSEILARHGICMRDTEDILVIDLLPYLDKEQVRDLIIKAANRLAEMQ